MSLRSLLLSFSLAPLLGFCLPAGPQIKSGSALMEKNGSTMDITCRDKTVINWDTFSIDANETLNFCNLQMPVFLTE